MIKDVQNTPDKRNIALQKVGVKNVETLLNIERKGSKAPQRVYAKAKMSVYLPSNYKGTHMSRFIEILEEYRKKDLIGVDIKKMLEDMKLRLESKSAYLKFDFKYFIKKKAPKSALEALMYSLLKREDEKCVTERAYENPKFVEDVIRDVVIKLENNPVISTYEVEIEAFESIPNHSAWAKQVSTT